MFHFLAAHDLAATIGFRFVQADVWITSGDL